jgi:cytochrome b6-f complex iron-sulfur subunit
MSDFTIRPPDISKDSPDVDDRHSRRAFVAVTAAAGACYAAALGYPIYRYLASPVETAASQSAVTEILLKDAQKLPENAALMFKFGSTPAMLIHHKTGEWVAFDAVCTHLGCTVEYQSDLNRIHCACHGGVYDSFTGQNVSGPPPRPLKRYKILMHDDGVLVSRA